MPRPAPATVVREAQSKLEFARFYRDEIFRQYVESKAAPMTYREIAAASGLSVSSVHKAVQRARKASPDPAVQSYKPQEEGR